MMNLTITARIKQGQEEASLAWWREKGKASFEALPWVRAVGEATVVLDDPDRIALRVPFVGDACATVDQVIARLVAHPEAYAALAEAQDLLDWEPIRAGMPWEWIRPRGRSS